MNETTIPEEDVLAEWNASYPGRADSMEAWLEWMDHPEQASSVERRRFADGVRAHAAKHAEEVAKKDAEIEARSRGPLHEEVRNLRSQLTAKDVEIERLHQIGAAELSVQLDLRIALMDLTNQLTAAREREEKREEVLSNAISEIRLMQAFIETRGFPGMIATKRFLEAYDASRAADGKEGA